MKGRSRKKQQCRGKFKKALVLALAGAMISNSAAFGLMDSYAEELTGIESGSNGNGKY